MKKMITKEYQTLGANLAYYRRLRGYTQIELAERSKVSRTHISNIEAPNMPTSVSLEVLIRLANTLEIPISKLFEVPVSFE